MRKPKKNYAALYNSVALAKAHQMPKEIGGQVENIYKIGSEIQKDVEPQKINNVMEDYFPDKNNTPFDIMGMRLAAEQPGGGAYPAIIIQHQVPHGVDLIIQNFCFFTSVDQSPPIPIERNILAEPAEYITNYRFLVLAGTTPIGENIITPIATENPIRYDGFNLLTQNPAELDPRQGINYVVKSGQILNVVVVRIVGLVANQRTPYRHGSRVRGFLRPVT